MRHCRNFALWSLVTFASLVSRTGAQEKSDTASRFERSMHQIAMRDGVKLHTVIHAPKEAGEPLPILLLRTPYGAERNAAAALAGYLKELADDGYIFVFQDIRGRYGSEGQFVMS